MSWWRAEGARECARLGPMQTVLITGASSGFGRELAQRLAGRGLQVFGASRHPSVDTFAPSMTMLSLDVRKDDSVEACVRGVLERAGSIDVLVNCAGYLHEGPIEELAVGELQAIFETNFFGVARMIKAVLPSMRAQRRGRIVNVGSVAGLMPLPFYGAYCATKHALEAYSESLRHELLPLGIDVVLVEPAFYRTNMAGSKRRTPGAIGDYDPHRQRMLAALDRQEAGAPSSAPVAALLERIVLNPGRNRLRHVIGKYTLDYWLRGISPQWVWDFGMRRYWGLDR
jgi:NAD(P)-dependent dehydrogenase (short-subunit alcohol dehydrogenase family)